LSKTTRLPRYECIKGTVDRVIGSHQTTDVRITEETTMAMHQSSSAHGHHHSETHTFVNTSREFAMLIEVQGHTLTLVSDEYIAVAIGGEVQAICEVVPDAAMRVLDWSNATRKIRFRTISSPLMAAVVPVGLTIFFGLAGMSFLYAFARYAIEDIEWVDARCAGRFRFIGVPCTTDRRARLHAALDRLADIQKKATI